MKKIALWIGIAFVTAMLVLGNVLIVYALINLPDILRSGRSSTPTWVVEVSVWIGGIDPAEVERINYTEVKERLLEHNFSFYREEGDDWLDYWGRDLATNETLHDITIIIHLDRADNEAWLRASDSSGCTEETLEEEKGYLTERVDIFAKVCNITADWSNASWSVYYEDHYVD